MVIHIYLTIDGNTYIFDSITGEKKFGWVDNNGSRYYADPETGIVYTGLQEIDGAKYYFDEKGQLQHLKQKVGDNYYFFGRYSGMMQYGWLESEGKMYYLDPETGIMTFGNRTIDGINYYFYEDGHMQSNFVTINGETYYYFDNGTKANDWVTIAGKKYFFNSLGVMIGENVKKVIDVSSYQKEIDWNTVIGQGGVDGVILRIAAGCEEEDVMLSRNIAELQRLGIPYGIYIYSYAENYEEGKLYANFTLEMIRKYNMNPTLGIYLDLESNNITSYMGTYEYEQVTRGFMYAMASNGYGSMTKIYTYKSMADNVLNSSYLRNLITWIAQYNHYCTYTGSYNAWQYSSTESIPGISGNVDVSVWFN